MIVYRIFDEISNNSYLFIIFNESSCSWFFTDEDAQAGLILINNLFLKLKHIQYINSIKQKTITDSLTGLYNSDYMWTSLEGLIEKYEDSNDCFSMVFIDLDKFKDINDTFGHPVGDEVLRFFAGILKKALHPYDMIIRYGGDEFAVILPRLGCEEASRVMNEFQEVCSKELFRVGGNNIKIGFSYGIENYSKNFGSSSDFFTRIDNLMYYSKEKKRSVK
jgi:diguanylate cyclase (GGDEF)-like protein